MTMTDLQRAASGRSLIPEAVGIGRRRASLADRAFAWVFSGLVYPQIWEDPVVDMDAMEIRPGQRIVTIASGGCNALSYLLADPASVEAVDLNRVHIAFNRLKKAAILHLPDHESLYRFFGRGDDSSNVRTYDTRLRGALDPETRAFWDGRGPDGRRRIALFARGLYRGGLLGRSIGLGHLIARVHRVDLGEFLRLDGIDAQREWYERRLAPVFERRLVRWLARSRASLFGLGIPPRQYEALAGGRGAAPVLNERLRRLTCDFPLRENYFAWQAFARGYGGPEGPLPPYLQAANFETVRARAERYTVVNASFTDFLARKPAGSVDRFVLLDAQDWMDDGQLNALWAQIGRTAALGARVIFRTAADERLLPGRVDPAVLGLWTYREERSRALHARDRSAIYGGFHLYELGERA